MSILESMVSFIEGFLIGGVTGYVVFFIVYPKFKAWRGKQHD